MKRIIQIEHPTVAKISKIIDEEKTHIFAIPSDPELYGKCSMVDVSMLSIASLTNKIDNDDCIFFFIYAEEENEQKS